MTTYGIDLGTTYCAVAYMDHARSPAPLPVPLDDGGAFASLVLLAPGARGVRAVVGARARDEYLRLVGGRASPPRDVHLIRGAKNHIGRRAEGEDEGPPWVVRGTEFTATDVSALILRALRQRVEKQNLPPMRSVVVTHPQKFRNLQRLATQQAALLAGLDVRGMLTEPDAAAWAYEHESPSVTPRRTVIFDFGGGTLDVVLMEARFEGGRLQTAVVASHGISCGGLEIDQRITDALIQMYGRELGAAIDVDALSERTRVEFATLAERSKRVLNDHEAAYDHDWPEIVKNVTVHDVPGYPEKTLRVSLGALSDWIRPVLDRANDALDQALKKGQWAERDIDALRMTGQSSLLVPMQARLKARFGRERVKLNPAPESYLHPATIVAAGAAVFAETLGGPGADLVRGAIPEKISFTSRLSKDDKRVEFFPTFDANTRTPAVYRRTFGLKLAGRTLPDGGRTIPVEVFEGESRTPIGTHLLTFDRPLRHDEDIEIEFEFARNGRFSMKARYGEEFREVRVTGVDCLLDEGALEARRAVIEAVELEV